MKFNFSLLITALAAASTSGFVVKPATPSFSVRSNGAHSNVILQDTLSKSILPSLAEKGDVSVPNYNMNQVEPGMLHFGVGNFQAAFTAAYWEDLMRTNFDENKKWGIVGASVPGHGKKKRDLMEPHDWLCTLVERDANGAKATILGSMIDYLPIDAKAMEGTLLDPRIKIVSLTVTEGGYFLNDGKFDPKDPKIAEDIKKPDEPQTVFGLIVKALKIRKEKGEKPFSVMVSIGFYFLGYIFGFGFCFPNGFWFF